jgi:2',3'-cyclic-nucleotide 2'-phosphodiesterase (5'-nucleotidase family)
VPAPDVALQNGGGMRDDEVVPPGPITELKTFDILPFSNFVAVVPEVPRETFKELLENAVSRVEAVDGQGPEHPGRGGRQRTRGDVWT